MALRHWVALIKYNLNNFANWGVVRTMHLFVIERNEQMLLNYHSFTCVKSALFLNFHAWNAPYLIFIAPFYFKPLTNQMVQRKWSFLLFSYVYQNDCCLNRINIQISFKTQLLTTDSIRESFNWLGSFTWDFCHTKYSDASW